MEEMLVHSVVAVGIALLFFYLGFVQRVTGRRRKEAQQHLVAERHIRDMWSPRLSGFSLQMFAHLANSAFGQFCLMPLLLRLNHFDLLRTLSIPEDPIFLPVVPPEERKGDSEQKPPLKILQELMEPRDSPPPAPAGFRFNGIRDYADSYRSGRLTPSQVAQNIIHALEDSEKSNPPLRTIVQWNRDHILRMAEASTARYRNKTPLSLLDGIPVCLKEEIKVVPYYHRAGTAYLGTEPEVEDATVTRRLREAGAVIIGVSNMHELGTGTTGCNPNRFHGIARNPCNPQHYTGGSSSGSAAAVAAGLCPLALGTDGGGSVRIPAAFCGVVGLKGTFGRISDHGSLPLSYSTVSLGPITTCVLDAAMAYSLLAGPDPQYPYGLNQPAPSLDRIFSPDLKGLTLGVDWTFSKACHAEILEIYEKAVAYLRHLGASVVDISIPELEAISVAHVICIMSEMRDCLHSDFNNHYHEMNLETRTSLALASQFTAVDYIHANRQRSRSMAWLKEIFSTVNCILTPATACTAPCIHDSDLLHGCSDIPTVAQSIRYMQLGNLTGIPGLVVPIGYSSAGLPIGLQVMAKWWDEAVLFRVGLKLEQFQAGTRKPKIFYDVLI
ncbi:fatty acid amide hydrolase isoform X2 [Microcaecilia unicolor]|uniref:Fatty acid amide hydrolase-like isoform X2 n=1 Tax=Microcaecilia unicolor TaxID=1415580 RepID=A0A6P7Y9M9_9AMPH|nr:fatty acid amide hydrolase-like isoform X2 [Microcaecilia unicolor]XP_030059795.1 fatty acid amide hydrolase-like isoform X2 [Microcaecilia unicolor]XP_030059796.1 fatty acid amide hydrolase-like isoform X2 [Microcaecilia unicolor]XP_030059797.1 fatty acid amide hydrolase-like isoform X2 [Microcaecilia unicolor]